MRKPKVVEIVMGIGKGCGNQISEKQRYILNPLKVLLNKGYIPEIWTLDKNAPDFLKISKKSLKEVRNILKDVEVKNGKKRYKMVSD